MWTSRPGRRRRADDRVCARCGARGASRLSHHPSGLVVLCRGCGHVHLSLRRLEQAASERASGLGEQAPDERAWFLD
ncbi:MAG: hypothetical protein ACRDYU_13600 [Actinomycetes bacterium]